MFMSVQTLADIPARAINDRDKNLMTWLAAVKIATEPQLARHFWPQTAPAAARRRVQQLTAKYRLLVPLEVEPDAMQARGLTPGPVYELSPLGRDWVRKVAGHDPGYQSKPAQYLHDLLVAEISVRLAEAAFRRGPGWHSDWFGEPVIRPFAPPGLLPDGLGHLRRSDGSTELAFFLELDASRESHGRPSSQIGRKIGDYNRYAKNWTRRPGPALLPHFPPILFITHGAQRLANLAEAIRGHRHWPVPYALTQIEALLAAPDLLTTPAWHLLPANLDHPDLNSQPLLNDSGWLTPPPRRQSRLSQPPVKNVPAPAPVVPQPSVPKPAPLPPPPINRAPSPPRHSPAVPPPRKLEPEIIEPEVPFLVRAGRLLFLTTMILLVIMMLLTIGLGVSHRLNAPPTPVPTATPDPFSRFPTVTPYGH